VPTLQGIFLYIAVVAAIAQFPTVANHPATRPLLVGGGVMVVFNFVDELLQIRESKRQ
jgi:UDP-N-acetylmuramyl pentapeptide phosphotransferase/UDP-N-acetylglucosamine-1-phosphate transferase